MTDPQSEEGVPYTSPRPYMEGNMKNKKQPTEWVSVAEELAKNNAGILPANSWMRTHGYDALRCTMQRHSEIFKHLKQIKLRLTLDEQVKEAEQLAKENSGLIPAYVWLRENGRQGLAASIEKYPSAFAHVQQERRRYTLKESISDAEKLVKINDGVLPACSVLRKKGFGRVATALKAHPESFQHIKQTPLVYNKKKGSSAFTIELAESRNSDMVKGQEWTGCWNKYEFFCDLHGVYKQTYSNHYSFGDRCPKCAVKKRTLTIEEAEKRASDMVKGQIWSGAASKYDFICDKHGIYQQEFSAHVHQEQRCRDCSVERRTFTIEEAEANAPDMVKGQVWGGTSAKYKFLCDSHGIYEQQYSGHGQGQSCPRCFESRGETSVANVLDKINLVYERQKKFEKCRNYMKLPFDFYIPSLKTLIEFNGEQHYRSRERFGGEETFKKQQHRDSIKRKFARREGFRFITISYKIKNIETYLLKRLKMVGWRIA